jgi:hypothetical protein
MATYQDVQWNYWLWLPGVEPWEACALSLDIEPGTMRFDQKDYSVGPGVLAMYGPQPSPEKKYILKEFRRRLKRLRRDVNNLRWFTRDDGKLSLVQFVVWLKARGIVSFPLALAKLDASSQELAEWNDVSRWLESSEFASAPTKVNAEAASIQDKGERLKTKQSQWNSRFVHALKKLGHEDPMALPMEQRGRPGVRSKVRKYLKVSSTESKSFENAWDTFRASTR